MAAVPHLQKPFTMDGELGCGAAGEPGLAGERRVAPWWIPLAFKTSSDIGHTLGAAGDVRKRDTHLHPAGKTAKPHNTTRWDSLLMSITLLPCSSPINSHHCLGIFRSEWTPRTQHAAES